MARRVDLVKNIADTERGREAQGIIKAGFLIELFSQIVGGVPCLDMFGYCV